MKKIILIALIFGSCYRGQAQLGIGTPSPDPSSVLELKSTTKGFLPPRLTTIQRNAILAPAIGLVVYNSDKNCMEWYNGSVWYSGCGSQESSGGTAAVSGYSCATASAGVLMVGTAATGVFQTITATVTTVGSYMISMIANGITFTGAGTFTTIGAQDVVLTATGTPVAAGFSDFVLSTRPNCSFVRIVQVEKGNAICDGSAPTTVVPITSKTGKVWMDRNLGASHVATAIDDYLGYGGLYQWGRGNDGHASIIWTSITAGTVVNATSVVLSITDSPGNAFFILNSLLPSDWRSTKNDNLWQGIGGTNNPCPTGYRLPTNIELTEEVSAYSITNITKAYDSPLKFVVAGNRNSSTGALVNAGSYGNYWSSTVSGTNAYYHSFSNASAYSSATLRANGFSVRCIHD
jgi:uncharacterized protein (TIGR02145 family)